MAALPNDCGCCEGVSVIVPEPLRNRPGLAAVSYRVGRHGDFLASAQAALSDPQFAALRSLTTRDPGDFTLALLDGWASLADVLTFYQERIANELWLRTASERDSIVRLAQLIGYRLKPGVAAETPLAFLLDETPGAPREVMVAIGSKVQSVPGANEKAQTFETIEPLAARVEWNTLRPTLTAPALVGLTSLYLSGTATKLQPGDSLIFVRAFRHLRVLQSVTADVKNDRTHVTWADALPEPPAGVGAAKVEVYALRQRAALFGHNAPQKSLIPNAPGSWPEETLLVNPLDLDQAYPKIVAGSWLALTNSAGVNKICQVLSVTFPSRAAFAISGKVTRIVTDADSFTGFSIRGSLVQAQSELLEMAAPPLLPDLSSELLVAPNFLAPVTGSTIALDRRIPELEAGRQVIITGKLARARVLASGLTLTSTDGTRTRALKEGESLVLLALPAVLPGRRIFQHQGAQILQKNSSKLFARQNFSSLFQVESEVFFGQASNAASSFEFGATQYLPARAVWSLRTNDGFEGNLTTAPASLILTSARPGDASVSESAMVQECSGEPSVLTLANPPLTRLYDRATVTIAANVANATHGETVSEILGGGDAAQANQSFKLRQTPLTYVRSTAPGGAASSLQIRVNDLLWEEVPTLFERGPRERIYTTDLADDGAVTVRFGDGIHGARVPSGTQNIKATYRRGIGLEGLVRAEQLSTLLTRPPGLKSALNPLAAEGADEPEAFANAQQNAPLTVLTLDRVVSLEDYEDFSRGYAGIAKALATWTWDGRARGVFVTVAGPRGAAIAGPLAQDLISAIHAAGDPFVPVRVVSYDEAFFQLSAQIKIAPDYLPEKVLAAALAAVRGEFSFEARDFGQSVMLSEVVALLQAVAGVVAVNITSLQRVGEPAQVNARLEANLPNGGDPESLGAAELLMLDPGPVVLEVMR